MNIEPYSLYSTLQAQVAKVAKVAKVAQVAKDDRRINQSKSMRGTLSKVRGTLSKVRRRQLVLVQYSIARV